MSFYLISESTSKKLHVELDGVQSLIKNEYDEQEEDRFLERSVDSLADLFWRSTSTSPCSHSGAAPDLAVPRPHRDNDPSFREVGGGGENLTTTRRI